MLIIFDLDDTLIDTSGSVTPFKMRECLKRLVEEGLQVGDFDEAYDRLLAFNAESTSSKDALARLILFEETLPASLGLRQRAGFCQKQDGAEFEERPKPSKSQALKPGFTANSGFTPERASRAFAELTTPLPPGFSIPTTPLANEILTFLRPFHTLALVTCGYPLFQREKMEKAGLDSAVFSKMAILEDGGKKLVYQDLAKEFSTASDPVWVCGDRVEVDLAPARELGFKTIHMRWGRGKKKSADWVDHSISALAELKEIIK